MWSIILNLLEILNPYFDIFNPILGLLGFLFSLITLFLSLNIQKKVTQQIEKLDYSTYLDTHLGDLLAIKDKLDAKELDIPGIQRMTNDFVANMKSKYTFLSYSLKMRLTKLINRTNFNFIKDDSNYYKFRNEVTILINLLEKEKNNGK